MITDDNKSVFGRVHIFGVFLIWSNSRQKYCTSLEFNVVEESMHGHTGSSKAEVTWRALLVAIETRSQVDPLFVACAQPGDCLSPMQVGDSMLFLNVSLETYVQCLQDT